ncbi:Uncharacterised protein [Yersinia intermedia]|nr:Uncharacterised protein [Yersinia intermedia]
MNKYRAKYTRLLFDFVFKFQFIFPKSICFLATQYHSYSKLIKKVSSKKSNITSASLFESNFNWKGVSFTFFIDNDELKKVNKWKNKMSLRSSNKYTSEMLEPKSFDQDIGWVAIGMVNIDCDTIMDDFNSIYMNSSYLDSAYITVSKYSAGLSIITFYILLNENATKLVKSIKPPKLTEFVELNSFNIFSNKIKTITILNEGEYVKEYIKENMFNVSKEAWRFLSIIKDEMGIKKENSDIYCVSDINIKQSDPYFSNSSSGRVNQSEFILLSKKQSVFNYSLSENKSESFVFDSSFNVENIDMTYMKTCDVNADKDDESIYCSNSQTHLAIVPLLLIRRKIDNLSNAINKLNLYNKKPPW